MDFEKVGNFIRKLREEKKWSQEVLAEKMYCERTKVNKIENGKRYIKLDDLILLSDIFKISLEELILGEKQDKNNQQQMEMTFKNYLQAQNTKMKKLRITSIFLLIIVLLCCLFFSSMYFFQNYKSIRVYRFYGKSENYEINDGLFIISKDKIYFKIDEIIPEVDEIFIYSEYKGNEKLIYQGDPNLIINDNYGYDSFISYKNFVNSEQKIYIVIHDEKIYLTFKEDFINDKIIYNEKDKIGKEENKDFSIPENVKNKFTCDNESCHLEKEDESLIYSNEMFSVISKNKYFLYDIGNNLLEFQDFENSDNDFIISTMEDEISCVSGNCKKASEIYKKFYKNYILKYLK